MARRSDTEIARSYEEKAYAARLREAKRRDTVVGDLLECERLLGEQIDRLVASEDEGDERDIEALKEALNIVSERAARAVRKVVP